MKEEGSVRMSPVGDSERLPSIRPSIRPSPAVGSSNLLVDKHIDPARYYKCKIKDEGIDRTPKPLFTDYQPGHNIYSVGINIDEFGKTISFRNSKISQTTETSNPRITGYSNGTGPAVVTQLGGGNRLGLGGVGLSPLPSRTGQSGMKLLPKLSAQLSFKAQSKESEEFTMMMKGLSDIAMEMGTMPKQPLVPWHDEARRLSLRMRREQAKSSDDLTIILKDTRLDIVYERLPRAKIVEEEEELEENAKKNKIYEDFLVFRAGNENYINKASQTINDAPKTKSTQTVWAAEVSHNIQASVWRIHDTFEDEEASKKRLAQEEADRENPFKNNNANQTPRKISEHDEDPESDEGEQGEEAKPGGVKLRVGNATCMKSNAFKKHLFMMERVLNMNTYQQKIGQFKHFYPYEEAALSSSLKPHLVPLWIWNATGLTEKKPVTSMKWNRANTHLLAAGYGAIGQEGLICGWNLKNLEYPERFYKRKTAVLSIDFSQVLPSFLSCGSADGTVCVYNVKELENAPVLDSLNNAAHGHVSPVWQVGWIERDQSTSSIGLPERLVSIASDGRVADWKINKGFDATELVRIKRTAMKPGFAVFTSKTMQKTKDTCLSRTAGGMTFSFSQTDLNLYLVGTDEGLIHLCNTNYSEQYLETYWGHTGPIFRVEWSPFLRDCFLSCSGDWSIRLWKRGENAPLINLFLGTKAYYYIGWSPHNACVFAALNETSLELWNINTSIMEPVLTKKPEPGERITSFIFSPTVDDIILIGDSIGNISVCKMKNVEATPPNHRELLLATIETVTGAEADDSSSNSNRLGSNGQNANRQPAARLQDDNAFVPARVKSPEKMPEDPRGSGDATTQLDGV